MSPSKRSIRSYAVSAVACCVCVSSCNQPEDQTRIAGAFAPAVTAASDTLAVPSGIGYRLLARGISLTTDPGQPIPDEVLARLPIEAQTAHIAGHLVVLREASGHVVHFGDPVPSREYTRLLRELEREGYVAIPAPTGTPALHYLFPRVFLGPAQDVDAVLSREFADDLSADIDNFLARDSSIRATIDSHRRALAAIEDQSKVIQQLEAENAAEIARQEALRLEIQQVDDQVRRLEGDPGFQLFSLRDENRPSTPPTPPKYDPSTDWYEPLVFGAHLQSIAGKPYDSDGVKNKYLDQRVVAAIERMLAQDGAALAALGLTPFKLESAARTPTNQRSIIRSGQRVVGGMFGSGHVFGMAFDIRTTGTNYDKNNPRNWDALKAILERHGLTMTENMRPGAKDEDPNHVYFKEYIDNPRFASAVRGFMLSRYRDALNFQREILEAKESVLGREAEQITRQRELLNQQTQELTQRLETNRREVRRLQQEKEHKQQRVEQLRREFQAREAARRERERGRDRGRDHDREHGWRDGESFRGPRRESERPSAGQPAGRPEAPTPSERGPRTRERHRDNAPELSPNRRLM